MQRLVMIYLFLGALAVVVPVTAGSASAASVRECRAGCNARFNPADVDKWNRWKMDSRRRACLARCR